ncbi:MAG: single-stranded DNA-binding protein [Clostridiales bacterium]|nr:single-stranded DNA-binding protein [Clostridiales bacterium]
MTMDDYRGENRIVLRGQAAGEPALSHRNHGVDYYVAPLRVPRLSGVDDVLNIVTANPDPALWAVGQWVSVQGEVRSYNNRSGQGSKLVITVLARSAQPDTVEEGENRLVLSGALCRKPVVRRTPLGREICDILLAVNRPYGRADYLPCIAWGSLAAHCGELDVGNQLRLEGRLQSRQYHKLIDGEQVARTAFEISVMNLLPEENQL